MRVTNTEGKPRGYIGYESNMFGRLEIIVFIKPKKSVKSRLIEKPSGKGININS